MGATPLRARYEQRIGRLNTNPADDAQETGLPDAALSAMLAGVRANGGAMSIAVNDSATPPVRAPLFLILLLLLIVIGPAPEISTAKLPASRSGLSSEGRRGQRPRLQRSAPAEWFCRSRFCRIRAGARKVPRLGTLFLRFFQALELLGRGSPGRCASFRKRDTGVPPVRGVQRAFACGTRCFRQGPPAGRRCHLARPADGGGKRRSSSRRIAAASAVRPCCS